MRRRRNDTDTETEAAWIAMLRTATPCRKFAMVRSLTQTTLSLSRRAIARRNPHLGQADLHGLFVEHQYGRDLAERFKQHLKTRSNEKS
jgi:hypothetical protein